MRSSRLVLLAAVLLGFAFLAPTFGFSGREGEDPRTLPGATERHFGHLRFNQSRPGKPIHEKIICQWTCADGTAHHAETDTVADCFDACQASCGNPCDWAQ